MSSSRLFFDHIELWLSAAGLVVIWAVPTAFAAGPDDRWRVAALTAAGVGVLHGLIFWSVRSRQRAVRRRAIREMQAVLRDRINNKLSVAVGMADLGGPPAVAQAVSDVADDISKLLATLSEDTLRDWQAKYGRAALPAG